MDAYRQQQYAYSNGSEDTQTTDGSGNGMPFPSQPSSNLESLNQPYVPYAFAPPPFSQGVPSDMWDPSYFLGAMPSTAAVGPSQVQLASMLTFLNNGPISPMSPANPIAHDQGLVPPMGQGSDMHLAQPQPFGLGILPSGSASGPYPPPLDTPSTHSFAGMQAVVDLEHRLQGQQEALQTSLNTRFGSIEAALSRISAAIEVQITAAAPPTPPITAATATSTSLPFVPRTVEWIHDHLVPWIADRSVVRRAVSGVCDPEDLFLLANPKYTRGRFAPPPAPSAGRLSARSFAAGFRPFIDAFESGWLNYESCLVFGGCVDPALVVRAFVAHVHNLRSLARAYDWFDIFHYHYRFQSEHPLNAGFVIDDWLEIDQTILAELIPRGPPASAMNEEEAMEAEELLEESYVLEQLESFVMVADEVQERTEWSERRR